MLLKVGLAQLAGVPEKVRIARDSDRAAERETRPPAAGFFGWRGAGRMELSCGVHERSRGS